MAVYRSRKASYGYLTLEDCSLGYCIKLNGRLYRSYYRTLEDAIREFDSLAM
jgi:hypothetical protein